MPQRIDVPGMGIVEFPDGMTDEQIVAAIKQNSAPQQAQRPNQAAMNPEVNIGPFTIQGESEKTGFNPAAMIIKAGHAADRLNKGLLQLKHGPGEWLADKLGVPNAGFSKALEASMKESEQPIKDLQQVHPGSTDIGDLIPAVVAPWRAVPAIAAAEYGTPEERGIRAGAAVVGNKLGQMAGNVVARGIKPTKELSQSQQLANEAADRVGVKLSAGEASGNKTLRWAESTSADLPFASGMATKRHTGNQRAMNSAVLRQLGEKGDEVTEAALAQARQRISGEYDRILTPAKIHLDNSFRHEVKAISGSKVMKELRDEGVDKMLDQFRNMPQGKISVTGEWFQQNKTALDQTIRSAYLNGQPGKAKALEQFEEALDRAAARSLPKADRDAYKAAQKQWATLRTLETGKVVEAGNVMPGRLNSAMEQRYGAAFKEGKLTGDVADVARLGHVLRGPPNSGSVPRAFYTGGMGGMLLSEPVSALAMATGPAAIQKLATSPAFKKYMEKGLLNLTPEQERMLIASGGRFGGAAGLLAGP